MDLYTRKINLNYKIKKLKESYRKWNMLDFSKIKPIELKGLRYLRQVKPHIFSRDLGIPMDKMLEYENPVKQEFVPKDLAIKYFALLEITPTEYGKLQSLTNGESEEFVPRREIPSMVKRKVRERDQNRCVKCGKDDKLHLHHIKPYSKGGQHVVDNLVLLCNECHVKEHSGDWFNKGMKSLFT